MTAPLDRRLVPREEALAAAPADELPIPLPRGWFDDPGYVLRPYAIAGGGGAPPDQFGVIGTCTRGDEQIAVNYGDCLAHAYFGTPKSGKSYLEGVHMEVALRQNRYQSRLPWPLCAVALSYGAGGGGRRAAEQFAARRPNRDPDEVRELIYHHGTLPEGLPDVVGLVMPGRAAALAAAHPGCEVRPLSFSCAELGLPGLRRLMLLSERDDSLLGEEIGDLVRALPAGFSGDDLAAAVEAYPFRGAHHRALVRRRVRLASQVLGPKDQRLLDLVRPGRLLVCDLRDPWLAPRAAMRLFEVLLSVLVHGEDGGAGPLPCNLLLCIDEAHKLLRHAELRVLIEHIVRERRHLRTSVLLLSQDPVSIPHGLLAEMDGVGLFQTASLRSIRHLARDIAPFSDLRPEDSAALRPGEMYFWARSYYEPYRPGELGGKLVRVRVRPRLSHHGGRTRGALDG